LVALAGLAWPLHLLFANVKPFTAV